MAIPTAVTELLPDEYKIDKPFSVHIFSGKEDDKHCKPLINSLKSCGSTKKIEINQYPMDTHKTVEAKLNELVKLNYADKSCLILVMMGRCHKTTELGKLYADNDNDAINIESIWGKFVCIESLRKKPKLFLIQATAYTTGLEKDSMFIGDCPLEFPLEADLFISYKNLSSVDSGKFIKTISEMISTFGRRDDIISIISLLDNTYDLKIPRIISTLTKKFYFQSSPFRGCSFEINDKISNIETSIVDIQKNMQNTNIKKSKSVDSITRATSLQNITPSRIPRSPMERRYSVVSPSFRPRANSKGNKTPWKP